jgi:viroplasmin and RNaseH domain-containing protein
VILKFNKTYSRIRTAKIGHSGFVNELSTKPIQYTFRHFINKTSITIIWRTSRSGFIKNLLNNSNSKTGHSGFLRTETMKSSDRVPDEFDTNIEVLKIVYKVYYRELNRDTIIYSCNL